MTIKTLLFIVFLGAISTSFGQVTVERLFQQILTKNNIDTPYSFDESTKADGYQELILTYLGAVKVKGGRIFKVLTYEHIWGPNHHASGIIYIFNNKNQYVGQYHLGDALDLPTKLQDSSLVFTNEDNSNCDKNVVTIIRLKNGLPKELFIQCRKDEGDFYSFSSKD